MSARVRRRARSSDVCSTCSSTSLFSGHFDADDLAVIDDSAPGTRYTTFCNDCGSEQLAHEPVDRSDPVARGRREHEACQAGTVGCSIDHVTDSSCAPW